MKVVSVGHAMGGSYLVFGRFIAYLPELDDELIIISLWHIENILQLGSLAMDYFGDNYTFVSSSHMLQSASVGIP